MAEQSAEEIVCLLVREQFITHAQREVWFRNKAHESIRSMRGQYRRALDGRAYSDHTLGDWVKKVEKLISEVRACTPVPADEDGRSPFGIWVASGHDVRRAADGTPEGRTPRSGFPDAERGKATGKRPRY